VKADEKTDMEVFSQQYIADANMNLADSLNAIVAENQAELSRLRDKLSYTYWIIIVLSVLMFLVGIALLSIPVLAVVTDQIDKMESLISGGFGIADLVTLFLLKPLFRIHNIMGDMSQITMALNSYQIQVGLRLIEMKINDRETLGKAAEKIDTAAVSSIRLVQHYFEQKETGKS
jgi:hypothetical protein